MLIKDENRSLKSQEKIGWQAKAPAPQTNPGLS
jgi:hypothetical protein